MKRMHRDMYIIFDARSCSIYKKGKIIFFKNFLKNVFYQQAHSGLKNREKTYSEPEVILQLVHSIFQIFVHFYRKIKFNLNLPFGPLPNDLS